MDLILASASPQRRQILEDLGLSFEVHPSEITESDILEEDPLKRAQILARMKAEDVSKRRPGSWIIGSDTLVVSSKGELLEKPVDLEDARRMLREQSGGESIVHSAVSLLSSEDGSFEGVSSSRVTFKPLSDEDIDWWLGTKLWEGRSGSFQIDGLGQVLIERLEGDFSGVVGLPVSVLAKLFKEAQLNPFQVS